MGMFFFLKFLRQISLQTRTKLQQRVFKGVLNRSKLEVSSKYQTRLPKYIWYKDPIPKYLISGFICKFECGFCNESFNGKTITHLDVRSEEHTCI